MPTVKMIGKRVKMAHNTFDDKIHAIVWLAYSNKAFYKNLWAGSKAAKKAKNLRTVLEKNGFKGDAALKADDMKRLRKSLNHAKVNATPRELMDALRKYTTPKKKINSAWVEW